MENTTIPKIFGFQEVEILEGDAPILWKEGDGTSLSLRLSSSETEEGLHFFGFQLTWEESSRWNWLDDWEGNNGRQLRTLLLKIYCVPAGSTSEVM